VWRLPREGETPRLRRVIHGPVEPRRTSRIPWTKGKGVIGSNVGPRRGVGHRPQPVARAEPSSLRSTSGSGTVEPIVLEYSRVSCYDACWAIPLYADKEGDGPMLGVLSIDCKATNCSKPILDAVPRVGGLVTRSTATRGLAREGWSGRMSTNRTIRDLPQHIYVVRPAVDLGSSGTDVEFLRRSGAPDDLVRSTEAMVADRGSSRTRDRRRTKFRSRAFRQVHRESYSDELPESHPRPLAPVSAVKSTRFCPDSRPPAPCHPGWSLSGSMKWASGQAGTSRLMSTGQPHDPSIVDGIEQRAHFSMAFS